MKKKQCIQKGIDLFVIDEKHWRDDKVCCLSNITKFIMQKGNVCNDKMQSI